MTEFEMRDAEVPTPDTPYALMGYIEGLAEADHDYGTSAYAASMAAVAAFNYVAHRLGLTGFQARAAELDFLRRTRRLEGPFMIVDAERALYPQYNLHATLDEFLNEARPWLQERAHMDLQEDTDRVHPNVLEHWESLAAS